MRKLNKSKMKTLTAILMLLSSTSVLAQSLGIGTDIPHASAMLHVNGNNKGVLINQVALASTIDNSTIVTPATGLLVYNTNTTTTGSNDVEIGFYYNGGSPASPNWIRLTTVNDMDSDWFDVSTMAAPKDINDNIYTNGNVGIGDLDPNATLSVVGKVRASDAANESEFLEIDHGGAHAYMNWDGDGNLDFREAGTTLMTLESTTGYLGIGTNNPDQKLHLDDEGSGLETIRVEDLGSGNEGDFSQTSGGNAQSNSTSNRVVYVDNNGDMTARYVYGDNVQSVIGTSNISTSSNSFSDVQALTITFTPRHSVVYVTFSISGAGQLPNATRSYWLLARLVKDGTPLKGTGTVVTDRHSGGVNSAYNVSMNNYPVSVTRGVPTTIKVQWRIGGTNTGTARCFATTNADFSHRNLFIWD